jgi:ABC-type transporter MlaC component
MPINPITLDKIDPLVIRQIETKIVDKIVHEAKSAETKRGNEEKNFDQERQRKFAEEFSSVLAKYNIKLEYRVMKNKVKIKLKDEKGRVLIETEVDDIESLLESFNKMTGKIIDIRG